MPIIIATDRALIYAVVQAGATLVADVALVGDATATGEDKQFVSSDDELEFLALTVGLAGDYNPLPALGEPVEAGVIYSYEGSLVIARQSHTRTEHDPRDIAVAALFAVFRENGEDVLEWVTNELVQVGWKRRYDGVVYELYNDIGANNIFPPPDVPAHWRVWTDEEFPAWVQPTGAHDAYEPGAKVTHNGRLWENGLEILNVWEPGTQNSGWIDLGPVS